MNTKPRRGQLLSRPLHMHDFRESHKGGKRLGSTKSLCCQMQKRELDIVHARDATFGHDSAVPRV